MRSSKGKTAADLSNSSVRHQCCFCISGANYMLRTKISTRTIPCSNPCFRRTILTWNVRLTGNRRCTQSRCCSSTGKTSPTGSTITIDRSSKESGRGSKRRNRKACYNHYAHKNRQYSSNFHNIYPP